MQCKKQQMKVARSATFICWGLTKTDCHKIS